MPNERMARAFEQINAVLERIGQRRLDAAELRACRMTNRSAEANISAVQGACTSV